MVVTIHQHEKMEYVNEKGGERTEKPDDVSRRKHLPFRHLHPQSVTIHL